MYAGDDRVPIYSPSCFSDPRHNQRQSISRELTHDKLLEAQIRKHNGKVVCKGLIELQDTVPIMVIWHGHTEIRTVLVSSTLAMATLNVEDVQDLGWPCICVWCVDYLLRIRDGSSILM